MLWLIMISAIITLDQYTKHTIVNAIEYGKSIKIINDFFYIAHYRNKGAAWGILQDQRYFFIALTCIVAILLFWMLYRSKPLVLKYALAFILGGAIGNLYDRVFREGVVDFLDFWFGKYNFPTFNVADISIVIGAALLSIYLLFIHKEEKNV